MLKRFRSKAEKFQRYVKVHKRWVVSSLDNVSKSLRYLSMNKSGQVLFAPFSFMQSHTGVAPVADTAFSIIGSENIAAAYKLRFNSFDFKNANDGTDSGGTNYVTSAPANLQGSMSMDGSSDYITTNSNVLPVDNTDDYSVAFWMYMDDATSRGTVADMGASSNVYGMLIDAGDTNNTVRFLGQEAGFNFFNITSSANISTATWHHVVCVQDATGGNAYIYIDGVQRGTAAIASAATTPATSDFIIGRNHASLSWDGLLSQFIITRSVLTSTEAAALYNSGDGVELGEPDSLYSNNLTTNCTMALAFERNAFDLYNNLDALTVSGATLTALNQGNIGYGYLGNGTTNYIELATGSLLSTNNEDFSFHIIFETDGDVTTEQYIYTPQGEAYGSLQFRILSGNLELRSNQGSWSVKCTDSISTNTLYHCTVTYNTSSGWVMYLDGSSVDTDSTVTNFASQGSNSYLFAKAGPADYFGGIIYQFLTYSSTLTSGNATTLYNSGNGLKVGRPSVITDHGSLSTGFTSYFKLDTDTNDSIGSNNLTNNGAASGGSVVINGAYVLDGGSDYLSQSTVNGYNTLNIWFKTSTNSTQGIASQRFDNTESTGDYNLDFLTGGAIRLRYYNPSSGNFSSVTSGLADGQPHMVTITSTGSDLLMYIDGEFENSAAVSMSLGRSINDFILGAITENSAFSFYFTGSFDETSIDSLGRTAGEIAVLHNLGDGLTYS